MKATTVVRKVMMIILVVHEAMEKGIGRVAMAKILMMIEESPARILEMT